jgi:Putative auto-transporter adhesin, head GIN domain/Outer membrane protein beta-barrel domain
MKNLTFALIALYCFIGHFGFAQSEETRSLPTFTSISIKNKADVHVQIGSPQEVKVISEDQPDKTQTTVNDGRLSITGKGATVYITVESLEEISISGIGKVYGDNVIAGKNLEISISGSGTVKMPIEVDYLEINVSGMGKLELEGTANHVESSVSGSAKVEAIQLRVNDAEARISGVGKFTMDVTESLELNISGSGTFYYKKKPTSLNTRISGIGKYGVVNGEENKVTGGIDHGEGHGESHGEGHGEDHDRNSDYHYGIHWETDSIFKRSEYSRSHWNGFEIGFNQLLVKDKFSTDIPDGYDFLELNSGKSINVNINLFSHDFPLYKRYLMFTTGIGITSNNYRFSSDKTLLSDTNRTVADFDYDKNNERINYRKNKLAVNYITVPLLLQFNSRQEFRKSIHVATGILFSYKFNSHLKLVYSEDGDKKKSKRHDEFNIEPFRYDATFRIGYQSYTLYASYSLNTLFKENRGPSLHPFQVGINVLNFDFF